MSWFYNCLLDPYFSKNVFTNHLFCDWLYVDFTSEWYTCSCQRVNCKPHFLKCESESFLSRVYSCVLESYLVLDKAGLAKVLEYMIGIKFRNIGWKRKAWIMKKHPRLLPKKKKKKHFENIFTSGHSSLITW